MATVYLIHSASTEAEKGVEALKTAGYAVCRGPLDGAVLKTLRIAPPAAVIIDMNHAPSLGRDIALALRKQAGTRNVPLVLVGGDPTKLAQTRKLLPDAVYTAWGRIRSAVKKAIANPPQHPVVPESNLAGYSGPVLPVVTQLIDHIKKIVFRPRFSRSQ